MHPLRAIILVLLLLTGACAGAKKKHNKTASPAKHIPVSTPFRIDTVSGVYTVKGCDVCTVYIENIQVHFVSKEQPSVSVCIISAKGEKRYYGIPFIKNMDSYSYGGFVKYKLLPGEKAEIMAMNAATTAPIESKIIVLGTIEK